MYKHVSLAVIAISLAHCLHLLSMTFDFSVTPPHVFLGVHMGFFFSHTFKMASDTSGLSAIGTPWGVCPVLLCADALVIGHWYLLFHRCISYCHVEWVPTNESIFSEGWFSSGNEAIMPSSSRLKVSLFLVVMGWPGCLQSLGLLLKGLR